MILALCLAKKLIAVCFHGSISAKISKLLHQLHFKFMNTFRNLSGLWWAKVDLKWFYEKLMHAWRVMRTRCGGSYINKEKYHERSTQIDRKSWNYTKVLNRKPNLIVYNDIVINLKTVQSHKSIYRTDFTSSHIFYFFKL